LKKSNYYIRRFYWDFFCAILSSYFDSLICDSCKGKQIQYTFGLFLPLLISVAPGILFYIGLEIKNISKESFSDHSEQDQSETPPETSLETSSETSYIKPENYKNIDSAIEISKTLANSVKPKKIKL